MDRSGVMIKENGQVTMVASGFIASLATIESPDGPMRIGMSAAVRITHPVITPAWHIAYVGMKISSMGSKPLFEKSYFWGLTGRECRGHSLVVVGANSEPLATASGCIGRLL